MKLPINSLRNQLLFSFLLLIITFVIGILFSFFIFQKLNSIRSLHSELSKIQNKRNILFTYESGFLLGEKNSQPFHENGTAIPLTIHEIKTIELKDDIENLKTMHELGLLNLHDPIDSLENMINIHNDLFNELVKKIKFRGFRNFGIEGNTREAYVKLFAATNATFSDELKKLKNHEINYLLYNDTLAIGEFQNQFEHLRELFRKKTTHDQSELLENYASLFRQMVDLRKEIGGFNEGGLMLQFQRSIRAQRRFLNNLVEQTSIKEAELIEKINYGFLLIVLCFIVLSIVLSFILSYYRAKPINDLTKSINSLTNNDFAGFKMKTNGGPKEIIHLQQAFERLLDKLETQLLLVEEKNATLENQNEELKKLNSELDRFVYSVSHDLRAPLASLLGLINLSKKETNIQDLENNLELQEKSVKKLDNLLQDILMISKNARLGIIVENVDFQSCITRILENRQYFRNPEKFTIEIKFDVATPLYSDPRRVENILNNLISNAIRFADPAKLKHKINILVKVAPDNAIITVEDNGIGIEDSHIEHIFDMFYRATDRDPGSGLGLYIAKETVDKLHGTITVKSEFNFGSCFTVSIPNYYHEMHPKDASLQKSLD